MAKFAFRDDVPTGARAEQDDVVRQHHDALVKDGYKMYKHSKETFKYGNVEENGDIPNPTHTRTFTKRALYKDDKGNKAVLTVKPDVWSQVPAHTKRLPKD